MVLLERDRFLGQLGNLLDEAARKRGSLVLLGGEAGVGKTTLVRAFVGSLPRNVRVALGACDPLTTPRPLAPLLDVAVPLGLEPQLWEGMARYQLFQDLLEALRRAPALVVFEDVHWADEATLDLLRFLGRRIDMTCALLVATYRDDEVSPEHPLRTVLGDLVTAQAVTRLSLPRLSEDAVARLAESSLLDPKDLYRQTSGNAFFVTEVLASGGAGIPASVRDAVLARAARLPSSSRAVLSACAVIGARIEAWLLEKVVSAELGATESCLDSGMLLNTKSGYAFRHELARQAILETTSAQRRNVLHTLILEALEASASQDYARLAHHAEEVGDKEAVLKYAPRAAGRAAELKAHREAAAQYARALRFAGGLEPEEKARLLETYALECQLTGQLQEAVDARQKAIELYRQLGDPLGEGENLARLVAPLANLGHNSEAEATSSASITLLEGYPPSMSLAHAYRCQSSLRMLDRDYAEAALWAQKAVALAQEFGDVETEASGHATMGAAILVSGDIEGGWKELGRALQLALSAGLEGLVSNIYGNLGSGAGELYAFEMADQYLALAVAYDTEHDFDPSYVLAWQALSHLYQGRWNQAAETAHAILMRPNTPTIARITALLAVGRLRTRRGDPDVSEALDEALTLSKQTGTLQRLAPVCAARAEAAWLAGNTQQVLTEARTAYDLALSKGHPWFVGELAYWQWQAGDLQELPSGIAKPFALQLKGGWEDAAQTWRELNCPYETARALSESEDEAALKEALSIFTRLGAAPMVHDVTEKLYRLGVKGLRRPRTSTLGNPAKLTNKELQVLGLLAGGFSNKAIAAKLHRSEKTIGHHVSAILGKLEVQNRTEAAQEAVKRGILAPIVTK